MKKMLIGAAVAGTPLAMQLRYWDDDILRGRVVVVWPRDFKPNPRDNAHRLLAYYAAGLISKFGRQWVCWGDLRTEHLSSANLQTAPEQEDMRSNL